MAPPPIIRARETTLRSTPSPPVPDHLWLPTSREGSVQSQSSGRSRSPARVTTTAMSASAAPALVGIAETAPPWYMSSLATG